MSMRNMRRSIGVLVTLAFLGVSGCLDRSAVTSEPVIASAPASAVLDNRLLGAGTGCVQASAVLAYSGNGSYPGFGHEDIRADFPNAHVSTMGVPLVGDAFGSYGSVSRCVGPDGEFLMGYIARRVAAPAWDDDGVERHYVISHMFFGDHESSHALGEHLGVHVDPITAATIEPLGGDAYHYSFQTGTNMGDYDAAFRASTLDRSPPTTSRLWAVTLGDDRISQFRSIDIVDSHDPGLWLGASGEGTLVHSKSDLHGPAIAGTYWSSAGQLAWGELYHTFSREVTVGPSHSTYVEP